MSKNYTYIVYYKKDNKLQSLEVSREENRDKLIANFKAKGYESYYKRKYYASCILVSLPY
jgi:hypothetical protein